MNAIDKKESHVLNTFKEDIQEARDIEHSPLKTERELMYYSAMRSIAERHFLYCDCSTRSPKRTCFVMTLNWK